MFASIHALALAALLGLSVGPPWISIEYPVNPLDQSMRPAFLLVHVFHHATPIIYPVEGTAEGIVNGERRTIKLEFTNTSRTGVYGLRRMWPTEGVWTLVIKMSRAAEDGAAGKVGLAERVDREEQRGHVVIRVGRGERTDHGVDVGAHVEILRHHGDLGRAGAHALFAEPVQRAWADFKRVLARGGHHDDGGDGIQKPMHDRLRV